MTSQEYEMLLSFQVARLVTNYNTSWDDGRFSEVGSCFIEDGVFVDPRGRAHEGRAAIEAFGEKSRERFGPTRHITANHDVSESASGWTHRCCVVFISGLGRPDKTMTTGRYDDEFVLGPDGPLFTVRRISLDQ